MYVSDARQRTVLDVQNAKLKKPLPYPEHVKHHLSVPGVDFVPAIVKCLPGTRERLRRYKPGVKPGLQEAPGNWPVIVEGCLEGTNNRCVKGL